MYTHKKMITQINKNRIDVTDWQFKNEIIEKINEIIVEINLMIKRVDDSENDIDDDKNNDGGSDNA